MSTKNEPSQATSFANGIAAQMTADDIELEASGYTRAMPRQFSLVSLMAFSYTLTATWNSFGSAIGISLAEGGAAGSIWTLFIGGVMTAVVCLGMAELSSAYPVAGAQYYWSFVVASPEWAPFASYFSATISTLGWWLGLGSTANFLSAMILAIVSLCHDDYSPKHWHVYLVYLALVWAAIAMNVFGSRLIPAYNQFMSKASHRPWFTAPGSIGIILLTTTTVYFSIATLLATFVTLLACAAPNFASGTWVFAETANFTGWKSDGLAFVLCAANSLYGYLGTDAGAHLAEEIPSPTTNVPKVIMYPILLGFITTLPYAIACMYVITDLDAVLNTSTGLPLIELYYQATGSKVASSILMAAFALCLFAGCTGNVTGTSRQMWSASRDNCFPFSNYWSQVSPTYNMPLYAACLEGVIVSLYGLIYLGSSAAFSSMVGACIVFMTTSYVIPQGILAWRGRDKVLPPRYLNLGRWGVYVNTLACLWVTFIDVIYCIPSAMPVTKNNMNWISVIVVGLSTYAVAAWYISQRKVFKGPSINADLLVEVREATLHHMGPMADNKVSVIEGQDTKKPQHAVSEDSKEY